MYKIIFCNRGTLKSNICLDITVNKEKVDYKLDKENIGG